MRLIRDFSDFYDGLQSTDAEALPLYVRKTSKEVIPLKDKARVAQLSALIEPYRDFLPAPPRDTYAKRRVLGFCGRLQAFYLWSRNAYLSVDSLREAILQVSDRKYDDLESYRIRRAKEAIRRSDDGATWMDRTFNDKGWAAWLANGAPRWETNHDELFRDLDTPVFVAHFDRDGHFLIEKNPCLRDLGFHKIYEPYTVWQSIDQYLGNQLAKQPDPVSPGYTDELRRDAHGFDNRSFKSDAPSEKKQRRKANRKRKRQQKTDKTA